MPRQDGRIEQGQSLKSAISARAWNRAQDAADIVLGERTRFGVGEAAGFARRLIVPCSVSTSAEGVTLGHVVKITGSGAVRVPTQQNSSATAYVSTLDGEVIEPVSIDNYPDAKVQLGVIVGGITMPTPGSARIVLVCISGLCVARVRPRYIAEALGDVGPYKFIQGPVTRSGDSEEDLVGCAEACSCGNQRIIEYVGDVPDSEDIKFAVVLL